MVVFVPREESIVSRMERIWSVHEVEVDGLELQLLTTGFDRRLDPLCLWLLFHSFVVMNKSLQFIQLGLNSGLNCLA